jgi:hypothetical protein
MSDLPSDALNYETVVAEYYLGLRGSGLMLSPLDLEQVRAWKLRGVPVPVVCRGLRFGYERALAALRPGGLPPRSLRAFRFAVEDEWRAHLKVRLGRQESPSARASIAARAAAAVELLRAAERSASTAPLREAYASAAAAIEGAAADGSSPEEFEATLSALDRAALRAWARSLDRAQRLAAGAFCALRAGARTPRCSLAAHREALRAHAQDFARGAGLTLLCGSV